jgi:hypothetical protein
MTPAARRPLLDHVPGLRVAVLVLACAAGAVLLSGWARATMDRWHAEQAVCRARVEAWAQRNPVLAKGVVRRAWACETLRDVEGR